MERVLTASSCFIPSEHQSFKTAPASTVVHASSSFPKYLKNLPPVSNNCSLVGGFLSFPYIPEHAYSATTLLVAISIRRILAT